jgi:hypothetical protein
MARIDQDRLIHEGERRTLKKYFNADDILIGNHSDKNRSAQRWVNLCYVGRDAKERRNSNIPKFLAAYADGYASRKPIFSNQGPPPGCDRCGLLDMDVEIGMTQQKHRAVDGDKCPRINKHKAQMNMIGLAMRIDPTDNNQMSDSNNTQQPRKNKKRQRAPTRPRDATMHDSNTNVLNNNSTNQIPTSHTHGNDNNTSNNNNNSSNTNKNNDNNTNNNNSNNKKKDNSNNNNNPKNDTNSATTAPTTTLSQPPTTTQGNTTNNTSDDTQPKPQTSTTPPQKKTVICPHAIHNGYLKTKCGNGQCEHGACCVGNNEIDQRLTSERLSRKKPNTTTLTSPPAMNGTERNS